MRLYYYAHAGAKKRIRIYITPPVAGGDKRVRIRIDRAVSFAYLSAEAVVEAFEIIGVILRQVYVVLIDELFNQMLGKTGIHEEP